MERAAEKKLTYEKPVVRKIALVADEVLAAGCKLDGNTAAGYGQPSCKVRPCVGKGS